jgi:hypothetical protein
MMYREAGGIRTKRSIERSGSFRLIDSVSADNGAMEMVKELTKLFA